MVNAAMLQLALLGLNPERVARLLVEAGSPSEALAMVGDLEMPVPALPTGIEFLTRDATGYPRRLADLDDAPHWLFVRGTIPDSPMVAVVGSRNATRYGLDLAERLGHLLGLAGWPVVSGLARGIDGAAHRGCLAAGGSAVAVLGSGIDVWYPASNRSLGERIVAGGGAVVSESGPGVAPEGWRFPLRNRIISGVSEAVIVVEAALRSGALITAHTALTQGREVLVVPGDLTRATSAGCNALIRDGAHPITDLGTLVEELELLLGPAPSRAAEDVEAILGGVSLPATIEALAGEDPGRALAEVLRLESRGVVAVVDGVVYRR